MTIKTIFLNAAGDADELRRGATQYAISMAKTLTAEVTSFVPELDVVVPRSAYGRHLTAQVPGSSLLEGADAKKRADLLLAMARDAGVAINVRTERSYAHTLSEVVTELARLNDVVVAGVDRRGILSEFAITEYVLFQSGRPIIVVPESFCSSFCCEQVVVAWDYSRAAARAMADALPLLRRAREVVLMTVVDEKRIVTSLTEEDVLSALRKRDINARFELIEQKSRSISDVIDDGARALRADLLVMGGYGHSRFREFVLGGATRGILHAPALPTLLSH